MHAGTRANGTYQRGCPPFLETLEDEEQSPMPFSRAIGEYLNPEGRGVHLVSVVILGQTMLVEKEKKL
jgi:hypothetical protein